MVAEHNTNDQYQTLVPRQPGDPPGPPRYATSSEMSIEFEVDGPYKVRWCRTVSNRACVLGAPSAQVFILRS